MTVSRAGDRALLFELGTIDAADLHARAAAMQARPGVLACIVGAESLYVIFESEPDPAATLPDATPHPPAAASHRIEVNFDGSDFDEFLAYTGLTRVAFLDRVAQLRLRARYLGFRAGFAYLDGWPQEWTMPRRATSRTRVPRGSFAIAAGVAGFYPIDSPGGWNLLGRTDVALWDAIRTPPNLIAAGDEVEIVPTTRTLTLPDIVAEFPAPSIAAELLGRLSRVVGPASWSRIAAGVSPGGPFDADAVAAVNLAVGNEAGAPVIECAMLGPSVRFRRSTVVAWYGADCGLPQGEPFAVDETLNAGRMTGGLRGWLAVARGGVSTAGRMPRLDRGEKSVIRVVRGPHATPLSEVTCEVTPLLDRVGIRLRPMEPIPFVAPAGLPSCGMQFGTIQLHPDGSLVVMGPDHPLTGGYLQPMTVRWDERWKLAQLVPGERVTFTVN